MVPPPSPPVPGPGLGLPSLGASLAVHGAAVATLVLALNAPWAADRPEAGAREVVQAQLAFERPDEVIEADPIEAAFQELAPLEPIELDSSPMEWDVPVETIDPFEREAESPSAPLRFDLFPERALQDPELPSERKAAPAEVQESIPAESTPSESTPAEPTPAESSPGPKEPPAEVDAEDGPPGPPTIVAPSPIPSDCPPPAYPRIAERRGWTGTVVLLIDVSSGGSVTEVTVQSSSGHDVLDEAAVRAVRTWRFRPGTLNGAAAPLVVTKTIQFGR